jgi:hypothetical protein
MLTLNYFSHLACASPDDAENTKTEMWVVQITGQTEGTLKMVLKREKVAESIFSVSGGFSGSIKDHIGGSGDVKCIVKGKIEKNNVLADFKGDANMEDAEIFIRGTMKGTITELQASGKWNVTHSRGESKGKWTIKLKK